jgi:ferredoxin
MAKDKLICNCNKTMPLDGKALAAALGMDSPLRVRTELCRRDLAAFEAAARSGADVVAACTQEAPLFSELHGEVKGAGSVKYVNIRETAGWSAESGKAMPKIAALLALADLPEPEPVPAVSYKSGGRLLIIGPGAAVLAWAERLAEQLEVAVLVTDDGPRGELPSERRYPIFSGKPRVCKGYLGAFEVEWEQANPIDLEVCTRCNACVRVCPEQAIDYSYQIDLDKCKAHRKCVAACGEIRAVDFERKDTARRDRFDLILDLSREPLVKIPQPPQGYLAPGADPLEQALAAGRLVQMVGEFEKPKFFVYKEKICAHSRSEIIGCTRCIDVCSTRAIASEYEENRVKIEPHLCMGCGGCATVCPSGAMAYAYPRVADMGTRLKTLMRTYGNAGGTDACLLFHNTTDGRDLIVSLGRRGRGLPARVIPVEVLHVASLGLDLMLGAIALGTCQFAILSGGSEAPGYAQALQEQLRLAQQIMTELGYGTAHFHLIEAEDSAVLEKALWALRPAKGVPQSKFNLFNEKRETLNFILEHLMAHASAPRTVLPLPSGAPYGRVNVDRQACTMCLACVGACPEGALIDAKELPQLKFIERNCVQCGLCEKTCPEDAITLTPRLLLTKDATQAVVLNEAEVFNCVKCGKPFATKRIIETMVGRLGSHSMFQEEGAIERLKMCADCRAIDVLQSTKGGSIFEWQDGGDGSEKS